MLRRLLQRPLLLFACLVILPNYLILFGAMALGAGQDSLKPLKGLFAFTPLIRMAVVVSLSEGQEALARIFRRFVVRDTRWHTYAFALLIIPFIAFLALTLRYWATGFFPPVTDFAPAGQIAAMSLPLLLFPGFTEEFAWRGYMQTRLQRRMRPLLACVVTGLVWGAWHGFNFVLGNWTFSLPLLGGFMLFIISVALITGWCFNRSGGNVFVAMLAHFGANAVNFFTPMWEIYDGVQWTIYLFIGGCLCVGLVLHMARWTKL